VSKILCHVAEYKCSYLDVSTFRKKELLSRNFSNIIENFTNLTTHRDSDPLDAANKMLSKKRKEQNRNKKSQHTMS